MSGIKFNVRYGIYESVEPLQRSISVASKDHRGLEIARQDGWYGATIEQV